MKITDIIGESKDFEPPFKVEKGDDYYNATVKSSDGKVMVCLWCNSYKGVTPDKANIIANHICELLNREHYKHKLMCVKDRSKVCKVCNLCHDCDIDVLNPGDKFC